MRIPATAAALLSSTLCARGALAQQQSAAAQMSDEAAPSAGGRAAAAPTFVDVAGSPRWTQARPFTSTRFWLADPGSQSVEAWYLGRLRHNGAAGENEHLWQLEYGVGVTRRLQLDAYFNYTKDADGTHYAGTAVEARFAFARSYGEIWGNPVLYVELQSLQGGPLRGEARLLAGGAVTPGVHAAVNLYAEQNLNAARSGEPFIADRELGASTALGFVVLRDRVSVGAESITGADQQGGSSYAGVASVGPAVWASAWPGGARVTASALYGLTDRSDRLRVTAVAGIRF